MRILRIALLLLMVSALPCNAAYQTMEITNIKASGTGSPAIPSTARIFKAYPGIEYNIRPAVLGGDYPYTYELTTYPTGMTINARTGEISWPNPTTTGSPHSCAIRVTDSSATQVTASWSVTVSTSGFKFVNSSAGTNGDGSISSPYNSINNMLAGASRHDIIYFRSGTHGVTANYGWLNENDDPYMWLGYPGETATIDMNDYPVATADPVYFDDLTFTDMDYYGLVIYGGTSYHTIRRCIFDGFTNTISDHENQGVIYITGSEGAGFYSAIQDNEIKNWSSAAGTASGIGSVYRCQKLLIENNYIHSTATDSIMGILLKINTYTTTVRGNKIILADGWPIYFDAYSNQDGYEICYNLLVNTSGRGDTGVYNAFNWYQGLTWEYRNTIITDLIVRTCNYAAGITIANNIISNPNTAWGDFASISNYVSYNDASSCFTTSNNLTSTTASTLVDSADEYKLVSGQAAYIGSRGWQLSDGLTPMELGDADPTPTPGPATVSGVTMSGCSVR